MPAAKVTRYTLAFVKTRTVTRVWRTLQNTRILSPEAAEQVEGIGTDSERLSELRCWARAGVADAGAAFRSLRPPGTDSRRPEGGCSE